MNADYRRSISARKADGRYLGFTLPPGHFQCTFRETSPFQRDLRGGFVNRLQVGCGEFDFKRPEILIQTVQLGSAGDGDDPDCSLPAQ